MIIYTAKEIRDDLFEDGTDPLRLRLSSWHQRVSGSPEHIVHVEEHCCEEDVQEDRLDPPGSAIPACDSTKTTKHMGVERYRLKPPKYWIECHGPAKPQLFF